MTPGSGSVDYYAVLQVHPDADFEVIEAAYRQLMKKHHPDMAGDDPRRIAENEDRAKAINQAWSVLRDTERRRRYDLDRLIGGTVRPADSPPRSNGWSPPQPSPPPTPPPPSAATSSNSSATGATAAQSEATWTSSRATAWLLAPLDWLSAAYFLLPGPYEWERGRNRELTTVVLLPPLGILAFLLGTGRLTPLIGHTLTATIGAWSLLALIAAVLMWGCLLRVAVAAAPSIALLSGLLSPLIQGSHIPAWLAWCLLSCLSLIFAARFFVFAILPTLAIILLIS